MNKIPHYPLYEYERDQIQSKTSKPIEEITLSGLSSGELRPKDLQIHSDTLVAQAKIARQAGFDRLAKNLERASELVRVSSDELLKIYEALRPGRSSYEKLESIARKLEESYNAPLCAEFVREAARAYKLRNL